jgi:hypothetical protein
MKENNVKEVKRPSKLQRINEDIFIYISSDVYIALSKVFTFDNKTCIGHLDIWNGNAPFYILFDKCMLHSLKIKGYKNCLFIGNMFRQGFDKNGKMYLRNVIDRVNCKIDYYPVTSISDIRELVKMKQSGRSIYTGFKKPYNGKAISKMGEAIELITIKSAS